MKWIVKKFDIFFFNLYKFYFILFIYFFFIFIRWHYLFPILDVLLRKWFNFFKWNLVFHIFDFFLFIFREYWGFFYHVLLNFLNIFNALEEAKHYFCYRWHIYFLNLRCSKLKFEFWSDFLFFYSILECDFKVFFYILKRGKINLFSIENTFFLENKSIFTVFLVKYKWSLKKFFFSLFENLKRKIYNKVILIKLKLYLFFNLVKNKVSLIISKIKSIFFLILTFLKLILIFFSNYIKERIKLVVSNFKERIKLVVSNFKKRIIIYRISNFKERIKLVVSNFKERIKLVVSNFKERIKLVVSNFKERIKLVVSNFKERIKLVVSNFKEVGKLVIFRIKKGFIFNLYYMKRLKKCIIENWFFGLKLMFDFFKMLYLKLILYDMSYYKDNSQVRYNDADLVKKRKPVSVEVKSSIGFKELRDVDMQYSLDLKYLKLDTEVVKKKYFDILFDILLLLLLLIVFYFLFFKGEGPYIFFWSLYLILKMITIAVEQNVVIKDFLDQGLAYNWKWALELNRLTWKMIFIDSEGFLQAFGFLFEKKKESKLYKVFDNWYLFRIYFSEDYRKWLINCIFFFVNLVVFFYKFILGYVLFWIKVLGLGDIYLYLICIFINFFFFLSLDWRICL